MYTDDVNFWGDTCRLYVNICRSTSAVVANLWVMAHEGQGEASYYEGSVNPCVHEALLFLSLSSCNTTCSVIESFVSVVI